MYLDKQLEGTLPFDCMPDDGRLFAFSKYDARNKMDGVRLNSRNGWYLDGEVKVGQDGWGELGVGQVISHHGTQAGEDFGAAKGQNKNKKKR